MGPTPSAVCDGFLSPDVIKILTECITEYCGDDACSLIFQPQDTFSTASFWIEAGFSAPWEIALLVELLHRASQWSE